MVPLQLRHSAAIAIRAKYGVEAAKAVLGHTKVETAEIYAQRDLSMAERIMAAIGCCNRSFTIYEVRLGQYAKCFNALSLKAFVEFFRDLEENDVRGSLGIDEVKQVTYKRVLNCLFEQFCELVAEEGLVLERVAKILGKRAFSRAKKARHPDADAFVHLGWSVSDRPEKFVVVRGSAQAESRNGTGEPIK
jgi:hypothetical protein